MIRSMGNPSSFSLERIFDIRQRYSQDILEYTFPEDKAVLRHLFSNARTNPDILEVYRNIFFCQREESDYLIFQMGIIYPIMHNLHSSLSESDFQKIKKSEPNFFEDHLSPFLRALYFEKYINKRFDRR